MSTEVQLHAQKQIGVFPSPAEWQMIKEQASMVVKTGFLPNAIKTAEQAIAIALKGRELGIPPMQAFAHIHIIQGKPTISAELMLALIFKNVPGAVINYVTTTPQTCIIEATRPGGKPATFEFSIEEAKKANLLSKDSWRNYPAAMLRARTVSILARALFPDAIMGCSYVPEELGAVVNEDGEVIDVPQEKNDPGASQGGLARPEKPTQTPEVLPPEIKAQVASSGRAELGRGRLAILNASKSKWTSKQIGDYMNKTFGKSKLGEFTDQEFQSLIDAISAPFPSEPKPVDFGYIPEPGESG